jgi:hypothetical protein
MNANSSRKEAHAAPQKLENQNESRFVVGQNSDAVTTDSIDKSHSNIDRMRNRVNLTLLVR